MARRSTAESERLANFGNTIPAMQHYRAAILKTVTMVYWKPAYERTTLRTKGKCTSYVHTADPATASRHEESG